ncbi:MAG: polysaccharide biosynthesis/export family protein [Paludibacter sp.]|nr:polysaccharide biosynthesis/export family protein [Paludibacter sp.]
MKKTVFLLFIALLTGCNAYQKVAYLQQAGSQAILSDSVQTPVPEPIIKVGDVLMITVNTNNPEASVPFNIPLIPSGGDASKRYNLGGGANLSYGLSMQNFLVDTDGEITYPVIGTLKAVGMTKKQLSETIKKSIYPLYITEEPIVLVRYGNFRVAVLGEVVRPGSFLIDNEKVSILEALALAGDMTIYGRRESLLLVRENNGSRETIRIDIRDKNLVHSPYFYLQQNDVLYVEPNDSRARASGISSAESLSISVVGTLISIATLIINILK